MSENRIAAGKVISLTYTILDESGTVQEQSDIPVEYVDGTNNANMFPKVAAALAGAGVGDEITVTLAPEEGFGLYDESKTFRDAIDNVPPEFRRIGARATFHNDRGESLEMTVVKMEDGEILLDGNHPFAGKTMTFRIQVKAIRDATPAEVASGQAMTSDPDGALH